MSLAKFAPLHGGLLARKGKATPANGEVNAESRSDKEISELRLHFSDRIQRLNGDPEVPLNGHEHSFDTEVLTPEPGSHKEKEVPAVIAAAPETEERTHAAADAQPAPLIVEPEVAIERRQLDQNPPLEQAERRADEPWDGSERRKVDRGLAPGKSERRKPPVFGKRGAARTPLSEMNQKRFNA